MSYQILQGDALNVLKTLPDESVQMCVTSPPYWGLRDYGIEGQAGLENHPDDYVKGMVEVFREVRRVLKDDGTLWLNLGDSYAGAAATGKWREGSARADGEVRGDGQSRRNWNGIGAVPGIKPKDLVGIPWRVAFALQADGWYLRSDIIWHKPNPMPESVTDRPTKSHEYVFLLTKDERYYYDAVAVAEPAKYVGDTRHLRTDTRKVVDIACQDGGSRQRTGKPTGETRNRRTVWTIATKPYKGAHFATYPPALVEPCVLAGSKVGDVVLDPFCGSGTTGEVALQHGRQFIGIELNPAYIELAHQRISAAIPAQEAA